MIEGLKVDISSTGELTIYDFELWQVRSEFNKKSWAVYEFSYSANKYAFKSRTTDINEAINTAMKL